MSAHKSQGQTLWAASTKDSTEIHKFYFEKKSVDMHSFKVTNTKKSHFFKKHRKYCIMLTVLEPSKQKNVVCHHNVAESISGQANEFVMLISLIDGRPVSLYTPICQKRNN